MPNNQVFPQTSYISSLSSYIPCGSAGVLDAVDNDSTIQAPHIRQNKEQIESYPIKHSPIDFAVSYNNHTSNSAIQHSQNEVAVSDDIPISNDSIDLSQTEVASSNGIQIGNKSIKHSQNEVKNETADVVDSVSNNPITYPRREFAFANDLKNANDFDEIGGRDHTYDDFENEIPTHEETYAMKAAGFDKGDLVLLDDGRYGIVRCFGRVFFTTGAKWTGIEFFSPVGDHDGEVGGTRYFQTPPKHASFVPLSKVLCTLDRPSYRKLRRFNMAFDRLVQGNIRDEIQGEEPLVCIAVLEAVAEKSYCNFKN